MNTRILFFVTLITSLMISASSYAESEADVQNRMISRVPAVDVLKTAGLVGETNRGFLEQRGRLDPEQSKVLTDENADRRTVYGMIASRSGLTVGVVGEGRAEQIRQRSAPGVWLQTPNGDW